MIKYIGLTLTYDGTAQGDIDRDAFEAILNTQLSTSTIVPLTLGMYNNSQVSEVTVIGDKIASLLQYSGNNEGINDCETFWATLVAEKNKATVVAGSEIHNHDCFIVESVPCSTVVFIKKP